MDTTLISQRADQQVGTTAHAGIRKIDASEIDWGDGPFEDRRIDYTTLTPAEKDSHITELVAECRFLRRAWQSAAQREYQAGDRLRLFQELVRLYRQGIIDAWKAEVSS
jgi:hypothetical protein